MGSKNPKAKGAGFERAVCQRLSLWVSSLTREDVFWRSAMSGGRATLRTRKRRKAELTAQAGDITATHPLGHLLLDVFLIECKFYKNLKWHTPVYGVNGELSDVWVKPLGQAREHNRKLMVIAKQNNKPEVVMLTEDGREWLCQGLRKADAFPVHAHFPQYGMYVSHLRDMLAGVDFQRLRQRFEHGVIAEPDRKGTRVRSTGEAG